MKYLFYFLAIMTTFSIAQSQNISFANTLINLGMSKSDFVNKINPDYYKITEWDQFMIIYSVGNGEQIGSIRFDETNKINYILKNWGFFSDARQLHNALYSLLKKSRSNSNICTIEINEAYEPNIQMNQIEIILNNRKIVLDCIDQNSSIEVTEEFE